MYEVKKLYIKYKKAKKTLGNQITNLFYMPNKQMIFDIHELFMKNKTFLKNKPDSTKICIQNI